ncbi:hypothetical protein ACFVGY_12915 [Streptomyces sp. NPDC127106]|uniref:hypothetical protein n=1 Tax=Streptomyces sp. NPDC127106 TaxID=3345360 RepID=UPI003632FD9F
MPSSTPKPTKPSPPVTEDDAPGAITVVRVTPNDSDGKGFYVSCKDIKVDLTLKAFDGRARWQARAVTVNLEGIAPRTRPLAGVPLARGVVLEPSSGVVGTGQTRTLRIRGTYTPPPDGPRAFWAAIDDGYPSRSPLKLICR